jgi:hypothetical protein
MRGLRGRQSQNSKNGEPPGSPFLHCKDSLRRFVQRIGFEFARDTCNSSCGTVRLVGCAVSKRGAALRGANSWCAYGDAVHGEYSSHFSNWCRASPVAVLAKQASATESPRVLRSSKSFSLNVSPTKIPLRPRGYTNAEKCPDYAHRTCVEKLNIRQLYCESVASDAHAIAQFMQATWSQ